MAFQYVDYPNELKNLLHDIFCDSFMQKCTRFQSFEGFCYSSAVFVNWNAELLLYDEVVFNNFIKESTDFITWEEMVCTATDLRYQNKRTDS